jgi:DNA-binding transcriptional ArsR family regulator
MQSKYERDYIARHERIRSKLMEMAKRSDCACFLISKVATELGMDQRTVRSHLKILEMDHDGVFVDPEEKQFCTREGLVLLANRLGLADISREKK